MSDFDAGALFLTFLVPVRAGLTVAPDGTWVSHAAALRSALARLPTAQQSPATVAVKSQSPFAEVPGTHFVRLFVLDDVVYNGRRPQNTALGTLTDADPIVPEPIDSLGGAWLVIAADVDAGDEIETPLPARLDSGAAGLRRNAWARAVWRTDPRVRALFAHCHGFNTDSDPQSFARTLARCQVTTTMPFHDYGLDVARLPSLDKRLLLAPAVPSAVAALGLAGLLTGRADALLLGGLGWSALGAFWGGLVATLATLVALLAIIVKRGERPFPPALGSDLAGVLKALYLQRQFADFVVAAQGARNADLYRDFAAFLVSHRPERTAAPTQRPGRMD